VNADAERTKLIRDMAPIAGGDGLWYRGEATARYLAALVMPGRLPGAQVEIRFVAQGAAATRIEIEHRGWERLGTAGEQWRDRNRAGWQTLLPHFRATTTKGDSS
jgi:hypothetical protein